jgi:hypothetical protein
VTLRIGSIRGAIVLVGLSWLAFGAAVAQDLPSIVPLAAGIAAPYLGQWDHIPVESPDRQASRLVSSQPGVIWMATNGRILRLVDQAVMRPLDLPPGEEQCGDPGGLQISNAIISHDALAVDKHRILVSSIWRDIFLAEGGVLRRLTKATCDHIRGTYSFAKLKDGRLVLGTNDYPSDLSSERAVISALVGIRQRAPLIVRGVDRLVVSGDTLFGSTESGTIVSIDAATGTAKALAVVPVQFITEIQPTTDGRLLVAGTGTGERGGCFRVDPGSAAKVQRFYAGECYGLLQTPGGEIWASIDAGIYQFNGQAWYSVYRNDASGIGRFATFAFDEAGNLWAATELGLWRHYEFVREVPLAVNGATANGSIRSLALGREGSLYVGLDSGSVIRLKDRTAVSVLPATQKGPTNGYDRGPLLTRDATGVVWALTKQGLFRDLDGDGTQISPPPPGVSTVQPTRWPFVPMARCLPGALGAAMCCRWKKMDGK